MKKEKVEIDEGLVCKEYKETNIGVESLALKYHVGKLKIKEILSKNGIALKGRGKQPLKDVFIVSDWKIEKYSEKYGYHYVAIDKENGYKTTDWKNKAGVLTTHIEKTYGIETPTLYDRRLYYMRTGNYWWEQWFDIVLEKDEEVKKCPYCEWTTTDIENMSGAFEQHLKKVHGKTLNDYLTENEEDYTYFKKRGERIVKPEQLDDNNSVKCPICGNYYERLTLTHMEKYHNIKLSEFRKLYPEYPVMSPKNLQQALDVQKLGNLTVSKSRFVSKYEKELQDFLTENGVEFECNRQILIGKEIDILVEDKKIGIEFDGLKFHTEFFGKKSHDYHLEKTLKCNEKGYGLIHIFEDEYVNHKGIVLSKLRHILGLDYGFEKVYARKCSVNEIMKSDAEQFLNKNHIQGFVSSTVYLGAFHDGQLVSVMTFKHNTVKNKGWELSRFATDNEKRVIGIGGKLFKYFLKNYNPDYVFSYADRRWTVDINDNLYTKIGFSMDKASAPDYSYYNEKVDRYRRFHKMLLAKDKLIKKYGFPDTMTEREMTRELGYDRIWNCGLVKYVYRNETTTV